MSSIFDYFATGANDSGEYPIIENEYEAGEMRGSDPELIRVQIRFTEDHFGMLIRHPTMRHWCGYVQVDPLMWSVNHQLIRAAIMPSVSYVGYGNEIITWMQLNAKGKLTKAVQIHPTPDMRGDYWVGFDLRIGFEKSPEVQEALAFLFGFNKTIRAFIP